VPGLNVRRALNVVSREYDISPGCELFNAGFPVLFFLAEDKYYNIGI